jgi:transcriptional regulator with XRE-family HTH domain
MTGFGIRLVNIRKEKKIGQAELAKSIGIHANVLGRYEREEAKPSIDTATKLADALNVSLDFLVGKTNLEIDNEIRDKILTIQRLPDKEKEHIIFAIDAMIRDAKARQAYNT